MINNAVLIKNTTLLSPLSTNDINKYIKSGQFRVINYSKKNIIHFEGEICSKLEIILSGSVAVERIEASGDFLVISDFFSDDIIGGNLLFSNDPVYPMTITAKEPTMILEIEKELLFELFTQNSSLLKIYLRTISHHAYILGDKLKHYINRTIRESVISYLSYLSEKQNSDIVKLETTKKALAEKIGVERTSLSRELAKMKMDKLINYDAKTIEILY